MRKIIPILCFIVLLFVLGCRLSSPKERVFETETFRFTIPAGWGETQSGRDYYNLGLTEVIMIHDQSRLTDSKAFFAVATSPLAGGMGLEERFTQAYQTTVPEIAEISRQPFAHGGLSGYEMIYKRPWGEPWWQFRDIWLEKNAVIYVLSFHTTPNSFEEKGAIFDRILNSFSFKD